jgi:uncharacterized protein (DUF427 family)
LVKYFPTRFEPSPKQVRVMLGGEFIAETRTPVLVWELPYFPFYYIPLPDVKRGALTETDHAEGIITYNVHGGDKEVVAGARRFVGAPSEELRNLVAFHWKKMDGWFEEAEEIFAHPRDPHHRVDVLRSRRHVRIEVDGETAAESAAPVLLFETGLPTRYYLDASDVRMDLLIPTDTTTQCPYKGNARYWDLDNGKTRYPNFAWSYPFPVPEASKIAGLLCFYNEKVNLFLDGERQERPSSPFST